MLYGTHFQVQTLFFFSIIGISKVVSLTSFIFCCVSVIQYFLSPILVAHGFIPVLLSNLLFMAAISYYNYLNFLGYDGMLLVCSGIISGFVH